MQSKGFYLQSIYEEIKKEYPEEIAFKTFKDALYKIRNSSKKVVSDKKNISIDSQIIDTIEKKDDDNQDINIVFPSKPAKKQRQRMEEDEDSDN